MGLWTGRWVGTAFHWQSLQLGPDALDWVVEVTKGPLPSQEGALPCVLPACHLSQSQLNTYTDENSSVGLGQVAAALNLPPQLLLSSSEDWKKKTLISGNKHCSPWQPLRECLLQAGTALMDWPKIQPSGPLKGNH